jgi:DNA-binding PadR family transcriptional regulator
MEDKKEIAQKIFYTTTTEGWQYIQQWLINRIQQYQNDMLILKENTFDLLAMSFVELRGKLQSLKEFLRFINEMLNEAKKGE